MELTNVNKDGNKCERGGGINPVTVYEPTATDENMGNIDFPVSLTVGKTYIATYQTNDIDNASINGGNIIYEEISNFGARWNTVEAYIHTVFFKATQTTVKLTSQTNRMFCMVLIQLD